MHGLGNDCHPWMGAWINYLQSPADSCGFGASPNQDQVH
jgi:hypothetical protein